EHDVAVSDDSLSDPAELISQCESAENIQQLLTQLPLQQQEILRLKFQENMSYKSIADITGLSVSNVGFILHTVLKSLRNHPQLTGVQS
ncbi:MAG: sigma-70 family RNA polymerase sigma factor, partial [Planctomycetes bacterium]|nr:sigma-70 family RNA polymerase sigma factor [Planctomycetota bacterium]